MGDRVLIQVVKGSGKDSEFSPVAYGHWSGSAAPAIIRRLRERMASRPGDVQYTFARLIQEMTAGDEGALSFGVWNADKVLTAKDSHGDAGVVLVDLSRGFQCTCLGGYLRTDIEGLPTTEPVPRPAPSCCDAPGPCTRKAAKGSTRCRLHLVK